MDLALFLTSFLKKQLSSVHFVLGTSIIIFDNSLNYVFYKA